MADALSRKTAHTSVLITRQKYLQDEIQRAGIEVLVRGITAQLAQLSVQPTLKRRIIEAQRTDTHLSRIWGQQETERLEGYSVSS